MEGGRPSGTVTFLFTDIENSSRLWDRHPVIMRRALEEHDALLQTAIDSNSGYVFTTAGDSFAVAFQTADAAAQAAHDIQDAISSNGWPTETPVRVRIGLHTGEADERGGDYFGPVVNRAARIEAAGSGGQTLCSATTAAVLRSSTTHGWELTDLGSHELAGLTEPEQIHQLGAGDFPGLLSKCLPARCWRVWLPIEERPGRVSPRGGSIGGTHIVPLARLPHPS